MQDVSAALEERQPRRTGRMLLLSAAVALALAIPASAFAAKGGGTTVTPFISLGAVDGRTASAVQPKLGSSVTFATGYPTGTKNAWVSVRCWQDGALVFGQGGGPKSSFQLGGGGSAWFDNGGAATCQAELGDLYWRGGQQYYTYLAETWFNAEG